MLKRRVLKEITPHSLRVLVTHALVVVERFPHLHSEVRDAAPAAPPVSTCPSRALLNHNLSKKKNNRDTKKKKKHENQHQSKQLVSNNARTTLRYNYHLNRQEQANPIPCFIPNSPTSNTPSHLLTGFFISTTLDLVSETNKPEFNYQPIESNRDVDLLLQSSLCQMLF